MVRAREAEFNLRESWPLTRQALQNQDCNVLDNRVSERSCSGETLHYAYRGWRRPFTSPKASSGKAGKRMGTFAYPGDVRDTAKSGIGRLVTSTYVVAFEYIHTNVGDLSQDAKVNRPRCLIPESEPS